MSNQAWVRDAEGRAEAFRLLASCFCEPNRGLFLEEQVCSNLAAALRRASPGAAALAAEMGSALRATEQEALLAEYASLFLGPFEILAPPYASVYLEDQKTIMGESTVAVQELYRESGLEVACDAHELPDHIAVELEFLGYLASQEAAARRSGAAGQAAGLRARGDSFVESHLLRWAPELCGRIEAASRSGYYRILARCLRTFLGDLDAARPRDAGDSSHAGPDAAP